MREGPRAAATAVVYAGGWELPPFGVLHLDSSFVGVRVPIAVPEMQDFFRFVVNDHALFLC